VNEKERIVIATVALFGVFYVLRGTAEKTARVQSMAIYSKSGLSGRYELSAFFLEDLLVPPEIENPVANGGSKRQST